MGEALPSSKVSGQRDWLRASGSGALSPGWACPERGGAQGVRLCVLSQHSGGRFVGSMAGSVSPGQMALSGRELSMPLTPDAQLVSLRG